MHQCVVVETTAGEADLVLASDVADIVARPERYDVVLDAVGGKSFAKSYRVLADLAELEDLLP